MTLCAQLKEKFLNEIEVLINGWKAKAIKLVTEGSNDEAILVTIKVNIGDIFYKLFKVSYKEYNIMEEYYKEQIKLETAEEIKNLFIKYYDRFYRLVN